MPPHYLLGQIANISAEALQAAQNSLLRLVIALQHTFGESWERVFRIAAQMEGDAGADDAFGEVIWRDMTTASLSQTADALGKFADSLEIPKQALWTRVPGVTAAELDAWNTARNSDQEQVTRELNMANMLNDMGGQDVNNPTDPGIDQVPPGGIVQG